MRLELTELPPTPGDQPVEVVERKGLGHPDTLTDACAEEFSLRLSQAYREHTGRVLHHNVDKALLVAGSAEPAFGGGSVHEPMEIILAGRATIAVDDTEIPVAAIAEEAVRHRLRALRFVDPDEHVRVRCRAKPGSTELSALYGEQGAKSNDTSIGVGFAPLSPLEQMVLRVEQGLNDAPTREALPMAGEDVKVMGVRRAADTSLVVAVAMVDRFLDGPAAYEDARTALVDRVRDLAGEPIDVRVNAADDPDAGDLYLTITGTSAESGDDGQVGRGNRINGLITPYRPMSLEAAAGKNPVGHVGKLYNVAAGRIAGDLVEQVGRVEAARCVLVSRIGNPVSEPWMIDVSLRVRGGSPSDVEGDVRDLVRAHLDGLHDLSRALAAGTIRAF